MPVNDALGTRMKTFYEAIPKFQLYRRTPVAIRIDGKAFHTFTRGFEKPFDKALGNAMARTMTYLCQNIQGCVFGYTQSDEITLILIDYQTFETDAWFGYEVQKLCSISASMATMAFNRFFKEETETFRRRVNNSFTCSDKEHKLCTTYEKALAAGAMFDARCFNIPKEEVTNLVYWRQLDAMRNSVQMVGQANFSQNELQGQSCENIKQMLLEQRNINWNSFPDRWRHGVAWTKCYGTDYTMPVLKGENRQYLDQLIFVGN